MQFEFSQLFGHETGHRGNHINFDPKQRHIDIAKKLLGSVHDAPDLLQRIIIGDESFAHCYHVGTKVQSSQWKLP